MRSTSTFTLAEYENGRYSWSGNIQIRYCSYCGVKAERNDIGTSHNHRHEEEIIYHCNCVNAKKEVALQDKISDLNSQIYRTNKELEGLQKLTNNEIVNKMKCDKEIEDVKKKYNIK